MTIKEFANLCGCNPQTLRYYDHLNLLKPVRVDKWSGYRFYEESQAFDFIKIKNLQKAGFTIDEIRELLGQDDHVIYEAFEAKITDAEKKLLEIKSIRQLYRTEMSDIKIKINKVKEKIVKSMRQYNPSDEFGISQEQYSKILKNVSQLFERLLKTPPKDIEYGDFGDSDKLGEKTDSLDFLNNPSFAVVYEKHGWVHAKDFLENIDELESEKEYVLLFGFDNAKCICNEAFSTTILEILMLKNPQKEIKLTCDMKESVDGQNHFWLLRKK